MKIILAIIVSIILIPSVSSADWYIIKTSTNRAVGRTQYKPSQKDLATRGEVAVRVKTDVVIPLEDAEFFDGKIRVRAKSQAELNEKLAKEEERAERKMVSDRIFADTIEALEKEGKEFKHIK